MLPAALPHVLCTKGDGAMYSGTEHRSMSADTEPYFSVEKDSDAKLLLTFTAES